MSSPTVGLWCKSEWEKPGSVKKFSVLIYMWSFSHSNWDWARFMQSTLCQCSMRIALLIDCEMFHKRCFHSKDQQLEALVVYLRKVKNWANSKLSTRWGALPRSEASGDSNETFNEPHHRLYRQAEWAHSLLERHSFNNKSYRVSLLARMRLKWTADVMSRMCGQTSLGHQLHVQLYSPRTKSPKYSYIIRSAVFQPARMKTFRRCSHRPVKRYWLGEPESQYKWSQKRLTEY